MPQELFIYILSGLAQVSPAFIPRKLPPEKVAIALEEGSFCKGERKVSFEYFSNLGFLDIMEETWVSPHLDGNLLCQS